jgi:hypothetical protein
MEWRPSGRLYVHNDSSRFGRLNNVRLARYTLIWLRSVHITRALAHVELSRIAQTLVGSESLPKVSGLI